MLCCLQGLIMKLSAYGKREWLNGGAVALVVAAAGGWMALRHHPVSGWSLIAAAALAWTALAAFFRVPERTIPEDGPILVSPADGVVKDIGILTDHEIEPFNGMPLMRIGIFLSVFDVHVNRAPADMSVTYRKYKPGRFLDARDPRCARENESLAIAGTARLADERMPIAVRQISGAIARRIVCDPQPGDHLSKGEIYGMIKFGSRTELYFPADQRIKPAVSIGEKVRAGTSVIAKIQH